VCINPVNSEPLLYINAWLVEKEHRLCFYIYGLNIAIVAGLFTVAFSRLLGRRWGIIAAMLGIGLNILLVGASPSVLRAAIMGCFALIARQFGRRTGINILALTAAIMAGISP